MMESDKKSERKQGGFIMDKQTALDLLDEKQDFLFSVSDSIWDHPETDYTETVFPGSLWTL